MPWSGWVEKRTPCIVAYLPIVDIRTVLACIDSMTPQERRHPQILNGSRKKRIAKGSGTPNTTKVGKVNRAQLEEIATTKMPDLTAADMDAAVRTVAGTARSMGIDVEGVK